jgi:hypothetical protein
MDKGKILKWIVYGALSAFAIGAVTYAFIP